MAERFDDLNATLREIAAATPKCDTCGGPLEVGIIGGFRLWHGNYCIKCVPQHVPDTDTTGDTHHG